MAVVTELIRSESNGSISFGNHELLEKAKLEEFQHNGDLYKVKTFQTMTKLEKNGMFLYESVPGTSVTNFRENGNGVTFTVEGASDAQVTVGLMDDTKYQVAIDNTSVGAIATNIGGKLSVSIELADAGEVEVKIVK